MHDTTLKATKLKTLIVDDEDEIRSILKDILVDLPLDIVDVNSGLEAWDVFQKEKFDLVISDIHMPGGISGLQLAEKITQKDFSVPVLLVTAFDDKDRVLAALRMGVFDFITKPVQEDFLIARIMRAMDRRNLFLAETKVIDLLHEMLAIPKDHMVDSMTMQERLDYIHELVAIASIKKERSSHGRS